MATRVCKKCGKSKPATDDYFNILPSGNFRGTCKSCMAKNTKKHYDKNPKKTKERAKEYKSQKAESGGEYTDLDVERIRRSLHDRCFYCDVELNGKGEIDHKIPVSLGGTNSPDNLTLSCTKCNRDKHNKTAIEFLEYRKKMKLKVRMSSYGMI